MTATHFVIDTDTDRAVDSADTWHEAGSVADVLSKRTKHLHVIETITFDESEAA